MEKLEQFRDEYMVLEPKDKITNKSFVLNYLNGEVSLLSSSLRNIKTAIMTDKVNLALAPYKNIIFGIFDMEEVSSEFLCMDIDVLERYVSATLIYRDFFQRLIDNINDDNFHDIYCLGQFLSGKDDCLADHFKEELNYVCYQGQGLTTYIETEDDTEVVKTFFDEELAKITANGCEKVKK